jgi:hypothetical protein
VAKVLQCDVSAAADAYVTKAFTPADEVWLTVSFAFPQAALDYWDSDPLDETSFSGAFFSLVNGAASVDLIITPDSEGTPQWNVVSGQGVVVDLEPVAETLHTVEVRYVRNEFTTIYINGAVVDVTPETSDTQVSSLLVGQVDEAPQQTGVLVYIDYVALGTTQGGTDIFEDGFEGGDTSSWDSDTGDVSVIDGPAFLSPDDLQVNLSLAYGLGLVVANLRPAYEIASPSIGALERIDPITGRVTRGIATVT